MAKKDRIQSAQMKLRICELRIMTDLSMEEIGKDVGCTKAYVSKVLLSLAASAGDLSDTPFRSLRVWVRRNAVDAETLASDLGMDPAELKQRLLPEGCDAMESSLAERLSQITGISAARLAKNDRAAKDKHAPAVPRKNSYTRICYPFVVKWLKDRDVPMTELANRCSLSYSTVYRCLTEPKASPANDAARAAIAKEIAPEKPYEEVFRTKGKAKKSDCVSAATAV